MKVSKQFATIHSLRSELKSFAKPDMASQNRRKKLHRDIQLSNQPTQLLASFSEAMSGFAKLKSPQGNLWIVALLLGALQLPYLHGRPCIVQVPPPKQGNMKPILPYQVKCLNSTQLVLACSELCNFDFAKTSQMSVLIWHIREMQVQRIWPLHLPTFGKIPFTSMQQSQA